MDFIGERLTLPSGVVGGTYVLHPPLIKASKLTNAEKGGVGKELSDGWVINFAIGCTFGCKFCYVDEIHKKFSVRRAGNLVNNPWGNYFSVPENLREVMEKTPWEKWKGQEVMLSSTHDPYLPQLFKWTRMILERALPAGVKFCIQTRSPLVEKDFNLISEYSKQVRLQVSVATMDEKFSRMIEPRVVKPDRRLEILRNANDYGLLTGIIIAPVFPPVKGRPDVKADLESIAAELSGIRPDHIYGESLHVRGINLAYLEEALGEKITLNGFDTECEQLFNQTLKDYNLTGRWWREY
jgi:DNA repair photolyase